MKNKTNLKTEREQIQMHQAMYQIQNLTTQRKEIKFCVYFLRGNILGIKRTSERF